MKNKIYKFQRSLARFTTDFIQSFNKIEIKSKSNKFLHEESYKSNSKYDFTYLLKRFLENKKISAMDVSAQGGFNLIFFSKNIILLRKY